MSPCKVLIHNSDLNLLAMKSLSILVSLLLVILLSCSKQTVDCAVVSYDESFTIELDKKYCFPDGNYIKTKTMLNEFCPCYSLCKWEGQMTLGFEAEMDGQIYNDKIGSAANKYLLKEEEQYKTVLSNIIFLTPCSESNPSPEIVRAELTVIKN